MNVLLLTILAAAMVAAIKKCADLAKYITSKHKNGIATQLLVWGLGVVAAFLTTAQAAVSHLTATGGVNVQTWNGLTKALLGIGLASLASVLHDYTDKGKVPLPLLPIKR